MPATRNHFKIYVILACISQLITGCSFFTKFYLLNTTGKNIAVTVNFQDAINLNSNDSVYLQLQYADTLLPIKQKTDSRLTSKAPFTRIKAGVYSFNLTPKSTMLVGGAYNQIVPIESVTLNNGDTLQSLSLNDIIKKMKKSGGPFPAFLYTYKIE